MSSVHDRCTVFMTVSRCLFSPGFPGVGEPGGRSIAAFPPETFVGQSGGQENLWKLCASKQSKISSSLVPSFLVLDFIQSCAFPAGFVLF